MADGCVRKGGDIYCASASQMFHVPVEKHGVNGHLRQKGKIAELALGYGGSVGALQAMGALEMGVPEEELRGLVAAWRKANPNICRLWRDVDEAVRSVLRYGLKKFRLGLLEFSCRSGMMFIRLPSGRSLAYVKPRLCTNRFGNESVAYLGVNAAKKWVHIESYGPKFVENIVQGIARDLLCEAMMRLEEASALQRGECLPCCSRPSPQGTAAAGMGNGDRRKGYRIVAHVHDEVIIEADPGDTAEDVCRIMGECPEWADGLILRADGYECEYYRKE